MDHQASGQSAADTGLAEPSLVSLSSGHHSTRGEAIDGPDLGLSLLLALTAKRLFSRTTTGAYRGPCRRTQIALGDTWQRASESRAPIGVEEGEAAPPAAPPWSGIKLRPAPLLRGSLSGWLALCRRRRCLVCAGTVQRGRQTGRPPSTREGSLRASPSCLLRCCRPRLGLCGATRACYVSLSCA